jgi:hypothetical protein
MRISAAQCRAKPTADTATTLSETLRILTGVRPGGAGTAGADDDVETASISEELGSLSTSGSAGCHLSVERLRAWGRQQGGTAWHHLHRLTVLDDSDQDHDDRDDQ